MKNQDIKKISRAFSLEEDDIRQVLIKAQEKLNKPRIDYHSSSKDHYLYFLTEDMKKLEARVFWLHQEIKRLGAMIGLSCDVSGETFHDNFDYEEGNRQMMMWSEEIKKLNAIKRRVKIIVPQVTGDTVSIGRTVKIIKNGQIMEIKIGSYLTFSPETTSYASPLIKLIFGARAKETREGLIRGQKTKVKIMEIK